MFNINLFIEKLTSIQIPNLENTTMKNERTSYTDLYNEYPKMRMDNRIHFTSDEYTHSLYIPDLFNDDLSYAVTVWFKEQKYALSFSDINEIIDDNTNRIDDSILFGKFFPTEEEHFQHDCLSGTKMSWEQQTVIQNIINNFSSVYKEVYFEYLRVQNES